MDTEVEIEVTVGFTMGHYVIDPHTHDWILALKVGSPLRPETEMGPNGITIRENVEHLLVEKYANRCVVGPDFSGTETHMVAPHSNKTRVGGKWAIEKWEVTPTLEQVGLTILEDIMKIEKQGGLDGKLVSMTLAETERTSVTLLPDAVPSATSKLDWVSFVDGVEKRLVTPSPE